MFNKSHLDFRASETVKIAVLGALKWLNCKKMMVGFFFDQPKLMQNLTSGKRLKFLHCVCICFDHFLMTKSFT